MPKLSKKIFFPQEEEIYDILEKSQVISYHLLEAFSNFIKNPKADIKDRNRFEKNSTNLTLSNYGSGGDIVYTYCRKIIKKRLSNEPLEIDYLNACSKHWRSCNIVYKYARYVIRGKYSENIENNVRLSYNYLEYLYNNNFEYQDVMIAQSDLAYYFYKNYLYLPEIVHTSMFCKQLVGDTFAKKYFLAMKKNNNFILKFLNKQDNDLTVKQLREKLL